MYEDQKKVRVLVIDDSILFRETISRGISADEGIQKLVKLVMFQI